MLDVALCRCCERHWPSTTRGSIRRGRTLTLMRMSLSCSAPRKDLRFVSCSATHHTACLHLGNAKAVSFARHTARTLHHTHRALHHPRHTTLLRKYTTFTLPHTAPQHARTPHYFGSTPRSPYHTLHHNMHAHHTTSEVHHVHPTTHSTTTCTHTTLLRKYTTFTLPHTAPQHARTPTPTINHYPCCRVMYNSRAVSRCAAQQTHTMRCAAQQTPRCASYQVCLRALCEPGDKVVFFQPFHELYPSQCTLWGLSPTAVT
jgi:hypothetical protein